MNLLSYDRKNQTLEVTFNSKARHTYFDVKPEVYDDWLKSPDIEKYYSDSIWSKYEYKEHWQGLNELLDYIGEHFTFDPPVSVSSRTSTGDCPLHTVCVWGDVGAVELLISAGCDVNTEGELKTTPIYNAVTFGKVRCAKLLLNAGANPDSPNELGDTARMAAMQGGDSKMIKLFSNS